MSDIQTMKQLVADAEELLSKLGTAATPEIHELQGRVEDSVNDMKRRLTITANDGVDQLKDATASVVKYVRANPWVAVAAGTTIAVALVYAAFSGRGDD